MKKLGYAVIGDTAFSERCRRQLRSTSLTEAPPDSAKVLLVPVDQEGPTFLKRIPLDGQRLVPVIRTAKDLPLVRRCALRLRPLILDECHRSLAEMVRRLCEM